MCIGDAGTVETQLSMQINFVERYKITIPVCHALKESGLPVAICMIVNLKYGYGGRTTHATTKPIKDPDIVAIMTLTGINHLQ